MAELLTAPDTLYRPSTDELVMLMRQLGIEDDGILTPIEKGCHNMVYVCDTPSQTLIVRHPKFLSGADKLQAEYELLSELGGQRTPQTLGYGTVGNTPVAFMEFIDGVHKEDFNALSDDEIEELTLAMRELHAHTSDHFSLTSGTEPAVLGTHGDYLRAMIEEGITTRLQLLGDRAHPEALPVINDGLEKLETLIASHPDDFSGTSFSLLHHDLNPENILWQADGKAVFIDLNPTYGDPCDDVNYAVTNNGGDEIFQKKLTEAYARITGQEVFPPTRMAAYALKNGLDHLAWAMTMCDRHRADSEYEKYAGLYEEGLASLQELLQLT